MVEKSEHIVANAAFPWLQAAAENFKINFCHGKVANEAFLLLLAAEKFQMLCLGCLLGRVHMKMHDCQCTIFTCTLGCIYWSELVLFLSFFFFFYGKNVNSLRWTYSSFMKWSQITLMWSQDPINPLGRWVHDMSWCIFHIKYSLMKQKKNTQSSINQMSHYQSEERALGTSLLYIMVKERIWQLKILSH